MIHCRHALAPFAPLALALTLAACSAPDEEVFTAFDGIGEDEVITLGGTEPFWGAEIDGDTLIYSTPDDIDGQAISVTRFVGNGGLSFSGTLDGAALTAMVTPGECSDAMSDRTYPFTATVQLGDRLLEGCGHSDAQPFTGEENP